LISVILPPFFNHSEVHHWPTSSTLDGVSNFNTSSPWSLRLDGRLFFCA
jgi:hypothetical protein